MKKLALQNFSSTVACLSFIGVSGLVAFTATAQTADSPAANAKAAAGTTAASDAPAPGKPVSGDANKAASQTISPTSLEHGEPESQAELREFLNHLPKEYKNKSWYGTIDEGDFLPAKCGTPVKDKAGKVKPEGLSLLEGDVNNDGHTEYILASRCGGTTATDTIIEVFQKSGSGYTALGFAKILQKSRLDGSKLPLHFGVPFLVVREGKTVMQFDTPAEDWVWANGKITKVKKTSGSL